MNDIELYFYENELNYLKKHSINYRKEYSQYFTSFEYSEKIINHINLDEYKNYDSLNILEPSAGTGNLILKIVEKLSKFNNIKNVHIDIFELDEEIIPILEDNLKYLFLKYNFFTYKIHNRDFINYNIEKKYDIIVSNPPYKKLNLNKIGKWNKYFLGQPNIYQLFILKCLSLLNENGNYCLISPKSFYSGKYSELIRKFIFENFSIYSIHSFNARNHIFGNSVIQEVIITSIIKKDIEKTKIFYNGNTNYEISNKSNFINKEKNIILVPNNIDIFNTINTINKKFTKSLDDLGYKLKIGEVVPFRSKKIVELSNEHYKKNKNFIPLLRVRHIENNTINYKELKTRNTKYVSIKFDKGRNIFIKNDNYLILKRAIDKENEFLFQPIIYKKNIFDSDYISFENNLIYFYKEKETFKLEELYGLFCIFNSKIYDNYYRSLNSSHGIIKYELEEMNFPNKNQIIALGNRLIKLKSLDKETCNELVLNLLI
jgi:adenine-specific DNA-methyltransferase